MNKWIDVNERLPKNDYGKNLKDRKQYLVLIKSSGLMRVAVFGCYQHDWWVDSHHSVLNGNPFTEVSHWMPVPEPPQTRNDFKE